MPIIPIAMAAYGAYTTYSASQKAKENEAKLKKEMAARPVYTPSDSSREMLADARGRMNSVSPGLMAAYQQLQQGAANQMGNAQRNASSGAQALSVGAGAQSQVNSALPMLAGQQDAYNQQNQQNYYGALQGMDQQERMVFEDKMGKYSDMTNFYLGAMGANNANKAQGMQLMASGLGSMAANDYAGYGNNARNMRVANSRNFEAMGGMPQLGQAGMNQMPASGFTPQMQPYQQPWQAPMAYQQPYSNPLYSSYLGMRY